MKSAFQVKFVVSLILHTSLQKLKWPQVKVTAVSGFNEQVIIKKSKAPSSSINLLAIHQASRDTSLPANKYHFVAALEEFLGCMLVVDTPGM